MVSGRLPAWSTATLGTRLEHHAAPPQPACWLHIGDEVELKQVRCLSFLNTRTLSSARKD